MKIWYGWIQWTSMKWKICTLRTNTEGNVRFTYFIITMGVKRGEFINMASSQLTKFSNKPTGWSLLERSNSNNQTQHSK